MRSPGTLDGVMAQIRVGTSGWVYKHWCGTFYPENLKPTEFLSFYSKQFDTAEINYSFYKLPTPENYVGWAKAVGPEFVFAVKASRYLTHLKKLNEPKDSWSRILDTAGSLTSKLGPILLQFPARWSRNDERLREFLEMASARTSDNDYQLRLAFEFRDPTWFCNSVYKILEKYGAAVCIADSLKFTRKDVVTAAFTYMRYHGRTPIYAASYSSRELRAEAKKIRKFADSGIDVFAYFNNDGEAHAIANARTLKEML